MAYMGEPVSASMIDDVMNAAEKRAASDSARARKAFEDACAKAKIAVGAKAPGLGKVSASFHVETGAEDEVIRIAGRVSDLLVMARPQGPLAGSQRLVLEAALIDTGRPLLIVPPKAAKIGGHVAIAWNGSTQAARAVALAMDFIAGAQSVTVLTAKEGGADYRPDEVREYLGWHGIKANVVQVAGKDDPAKALLSAAGKAGADLLVMGAYGHSRMREMVFGGVTRHIARHMTVPTLFSH